MKKKGNPIKQLLIIMLILFSMANISFAQKTTELYYLIVSQNESSFDPNKISVNITGIDIVGKIDIYFNGDKISEWTNGGKMIALTIKDGENILRIEGKIEKNIYLMVSVYTPLIKNYAVEGYKDGHILIKEVLTPEKVESGFIYKFDVE